MAIDGLRRITVEFSAPASLGDGFRRIRAQCSVLVVVSLAWALSGLGIIPPRANWPGLIDRLFRTYGFMAIGPVSFLENIAGFNVFFPGSVTILIAMAYSAGDLSLATRTFVTIVVPAFLAHHVNFHLGRRLAAEAPVENSARYTSSKSLALAFATTLWHPHFAALACMDMGAQRVPYGRFGMAHVPWFVIWNAFWGAAMYTAGPALFSEGKFPSIILGLILVWLFWDLLRVRVNLRASEGARDVQ